jgi:hypothetical protein
MTATMKDYNFGVRPLCANCKRELDPEEDAFHDGYMGSSRAHNGAGSYGTSDHHFVFAKLCSACQNNCPACALEQELQNFSDEEIALVLWRDVGGLLCKTSSYWLIGLADEHLHEVEAFYAWDDTKASRAAYVQLVRGLRENYGEDYAPDYIPVHRQNYSCKEKIEGIIEKLS